MPTYKYKAKRGPEDLIEGELSAESQEHMIAKLDSMELIPISIAEKKEEKLEKVLIKEKKDKKQINESVLTAKRRVSLFSVKIKSKDIDAFTWQLASLNKANVPMLRALSLIEQQTENIALKGVVADLVQQVKDGKMLSEAMAKYPKLFNNLFISMIRSGEKGGVLSEVLYKLAEYQEKEQALRRKVQSALAYPMVMLSVGVGTIFIMLTFFMPKFIRIFENMKQELPMPTKVLIGLSHFMSTHWHWFMIALGLVWVLLGRMNPSGKKKAFMDMIKLHMPLVKKFVLDSEISKFCRALGMLLRNGLPVYESLDLSTNTLDNETLRDRLKRASEEIVQQGTTLSLSLEKVKVFPIFAVNMIAVGEEGGRLEDSLEGIADAYEREVEQAVSLMTSLIEPILILVIGGIVGFMVFAMLLPIFNIGVIAK